MAKIWRRKKSGREVGSFHVLRDGKPLNLKTKDAREANRRARLALRGEWPDNSTARAADAAKLAEHVPETPPEQSPAEKAVGAQASVPQPAGFAESPPPAAAPLPPEPEPAAAAQAAAVDVAGPPSPSDGDLAAAMGQALQREFFPAGGEAEGDIGKLGAALCLSIEHEIGVMIAERQKPPRTIPEPTEQDVMFRVLRCAFGVLGRSWTGNIAIHPMWVIGAALVAYPIQMAIASRPRLQSVPQQGEAPQPNGVA